MCHSTLRLPRNFGATTKQNAVSHKRVVQQLAIFNRDRHSQPLTSSCPGPPVCYLPTEKLGHPDLLVLGQGREDPSTRPHEFAAGDSLSLKAPSAIGTFISSFTGDRMR